MKFIIIVPTLLLLLASRTGNCDEIFFEISSTTPDVSVSPRAHDRRAIPLPDLTYEFRIKAGCASGLLPEAVLLSVADTRHRFSLADMQATADDMTIRVPAGQIAPLKVAGFCLNSDETVNGRGEQLTVRAILSAQASLMCTDEEHQQISYASQPLDVSLTCVGEQPD
jgi:hypothetical protein